MPSKRISLVFMMLGLAILIGCGSTATHTAYVTLPSGNAVAAFRINNTTAQFTSIVGSPYPSGNSPSSIVVDPPNHFVYVTNQLDNTISRFTIDPTIGSLKEVLPRTPTGLTPGSLAMDASGTFLFALNQVSSSVSVYSINPTRGALTAVTGSPFATAANPIAMALAPSGKFLYVLDANLALVFAYTVNAGVLQPVPGLPVQVGNGALAITVDPAGNLVYVANATDSTISVFSLNSTTGALALLGTFATGTRPTSLEVLGQFLYVADLGASNISVFSVAPTTGFLTQVTGSPFGTSGAPLFEVIDPNHLFIYTGSQTSMTISAQSIDVTTGVLTTTSESATTEFAPSSMAVTK
jgi:6-phosphogluconolactonase (cycloisomerase 2 family)